LRNSIAVEEREALDRRREDDRMGHGFSRMNTDVGGE
jgi:hypothetical protein